MSRKQIPFAMKNALNDTMFNVREHEIKTVYPKAFTVRNQRFFSAIMRIKPKATKTKPEVTLQDMGKGGGRPYLDRHTSGGIKTGNGHRVAIPVDARTKKTGGVVKSQRPRAALSKPKVFKMTGKSGKTLIAQRMGTKRNRKIRILYALKQSVHITKRFPFYSAGLKRADKFFPVFFTKRMKEAMRPRGS